MLLGTEERSNDCTASSSSRCGTAGESMSVACSAQVQPMAVSPPRWGARRRRSGGSTCLLRRLLLVCCGLGHGGPLDPAVGTAQPVPGDFELNKVLMPGEPLHIKVAIGTAKFLKFSCDGGPADVVISLSTYSEQADPLLFLSLNPNEPPSFQQHDASSFAQWKEDAAGDHYVVARAVGHGGGIVGLVNVKNFAGEELDGILNIRCTYIIAFDTLFWDHLKDSAVCPVGSHKSEQGSEVQADFCSGQGQCGKHGVCECNSDFTGPACEHSKDDVVVAAEGQYEFKVPPSRYQYFRVKVPNGFPGGYLEVEVKSEQPLVVLIRGDDLPTKNNYDLCNFDDWVNRRNKTILRFKVDEQEGSPVAQGHRLPGGDTVPSVGRRLEVRSWSDLFRVVGDTNSDPFEVDRGFSDATSSTWRSERRLQENTLPVGEAPPMHCEADEKRWQTPACRTAQVTQCKESCWSCLMCHDGCTRGRRAESPANCSEKCSMCGSMQCKSELARCAGAISCRSEEVQKCEAGCGACMGCFSDSDEKRQACQCCANCLPQAAKCNLMQMQSSDYNHFTFVGVFNHRRHSSERAPVAAVANIKLTSDENFMREDVPRSWVAELYDPYRDIRTLGITHRGAYPDGDQYVYNLELTPDSSIRKPVKLYQDRMTLVHITNAGAAKTMELSFVAGPNITHVLASTTGEPKTFFDFYQVQTQVKDRIQIHSDGRESIWCALLGASGGWVQVSANAVGEAPAAPVPVGFALVCVFALLLGLSVLGALYGGAQRLSERLGMDPSMPLRERFSNLVSSDGRVRSNNPHESTASLTRAGSLSGYVGSDVIDRSVEDQYLHRGGIGDDGI